MLFDEESNFLMPGIQQIATRSKLVLERGEGSLLWDDRGRRFIDLFAGVGVCSVGHSHPRFIQEVSAQLNKLIVGSFTTRVRAELAALLVSLLPGDLNQVQFYSAGGEAVEAALRLAKAYTGRTEFLSFWGGFHGKTAGALALCGLPARRGYGPPPPGFFLAPYAECYRCALGLNPDTCSLECVDFAEQVMTRSLHGGLAAIVVEPVQGTNGNVVPPAAFLPALAELAHRHGALLIVDEIITGFGRSGRMFASEAASAAPDILVMGKGMANGVPISAIAASQQVAAARPFADPSGSSSSFGGNPLSCAAALATVKIILEESLADNARQTGGLVLQRLRAFRQRYSFIGEVYGEGLLLGLDLVAGKQTKQPLGETVTGKIFDRLLSEGVLAMAYGPRIRINPALNITAGLAEEALEKMQRVLDSIEADYF